MAGRAAQLLALLEQLESGCAERRQPTHELQQVDLGFDAPGFGAQLVYGALVRLGQADRKRGFEGGSVFAKSLYRMSSNGRHSLHSMHGRPGRTRSTISESVLSRVSPRTRDKEFSLAAWDLRVARYAGGPGLYCFVEVW